MNDQHRTRFQTTEATTQTTVPPLDERRGRHRRERRPVLPVGRHRRPVETVTDPTSYVGRHRDEAQRPATPWDPPCSCGAPARVVFETEQYGPVSWCGGPQQ